MLTDVFAECVRKLEPGGRIAVNVANLGRKPYRSLSADVIRILQDDLGLLLRGEVIWQKGEGASGSCAWGSFRSAANPVLRDITERVIVASKGRFDRARTVKQRARGGPAAREHAMADDFMALTLDVWEIPPESARRVGHPAPFPVELPEQLIRLYTYEDDLVLDPFMGSGSAWSPRPASAAGTSATTSTRLRRHRPPPGRAEVVEPDNHTPVTVAGKPALKLAEQVLEDAGFTIESTNRRIPHTGLSVSLVATGTRTVQRGSSTSAEHSRATGAGSPY